MVNAALYELSWYEFDATENSVALARYRHRAAFYAADDEAAKLRASELWSERNERAPYKGWDNREYPREPALTKPINWSPA